MEAFKFMQCGKCQTKHKVSMGEMTQEDFDDYLSDDDLAKEPNSIIECSYCKIKTLHQEIAWELEEEPEE